MHDYAFEALIIRVFFVTYFVSYLHGQCVEITASSLIVGVVETSVFVQFVNLSAHCVSCHELILKLQQEGYGARFGMPRANAKKPCIRSRCDFIN